MEVPTFAPLKCRWSRQHELLEKLNMQAVVNASAQEDEFVKDFLITHDKIRVLVHDLLLTEVWKQKIFSELIDVDFNPKSTFPIYLILYHEGTVINLLETIFFYKETAETAEDCIMDLLDYCYRKLTEMVARMEEVEDDTDELLNGNDIASTVSNSSMEELEKQDRKLTFEICVRALTLLRYITDHLDSLPLSVMTRILNTLDIPILLVQLVEMPPWSRSKAGKQYKYIDNKWQEVDFDDSWKLTKIEGQVWIALFNLLMSPSCQQKYDLNSYKKNAILKLRSFLTEPMLDQIPVLGEMQRFLEHLSMMDPPPPKKDVLLEQVPEIREGILKSNEGNWAKLAKKQAKTFLNPSESDLRTLAKRWADTYNFDVIEGLLSDPPKCAACGEAASKRCSRCQNEWYCRRECQVQHWSKHKKACNLMHEATEKLKQAQTES
ncbi:hypothetical protein CHS0354_029711 [Potamilus streckersoni]|uniref:Zinc finger MYND domain-containing protein 10 n=1 Tax=Potamilus streckersoni TaxID=2493646 RepID=A0AAE0VID8_9BIVA|nr:hypothetical protein CHS0354_029711 [Potamilus streckersoni]